MKVSLKTRICTIAAVGTIVLAGAAAAQGEGKPDGMTAQQYKAELIRGDALNKRYGLGKYSLSAQGGPRPDGLTIQQWQAELIRGDALNKRYSLGKYSLSAQGRPRPDGLTIQQWQAELIRGDALNKRYGLGKYGDTVNTSARSTVNAGPTGSVASGGFDWGDAGIGAGAVIGLGLLALGMAVAVRQARRPGLTTTN